MQAVIIAIATTIIGIVVTILISRHYYGRSSKHRLAIYSFPFPEILEEVDPDTRRDLAVNFRGKEVKELSVMELLIANEGSSTIRDTLSPLSASLGDRYQIVDASLVYVHPEGRQIDLDVADRQFSCRFLLLNPGEYFYIKLITDGRVRRQDIRFTIIAEGLPPRIDVESGAGVNIRGSDEHSFDFGGLVAALIFFLIGLSIGLPVVALYRVHPAYFPFASPGFQFVWWLTVPLAIATLLSVIVIIVVLAVAATVVFGSIPRRPEFRRPGRYGTHFYGYGRPVRPFEMESAAIRYPREDETIRHRGDAGGDG